MEAKITKSVALTLDEGEATTLDRVLTVAYNYCDSSDEQFIRDLRIAVGQAVND